MVEVSKKYEVLYHDFCVWHAECNLRVDLYKPNRQSWYRNTSFLELKLNF